MRSILVLISLMALMGCARPHILEQRLTPGQYLPLGRYRTLADPAAINRHAAYLDPGDTIPVKLGIESAWVGLEQNQVNLVVRRKLFFRVTLPEEISQENLEKLRGLNQERLARMTPREKANLFRGIMLYMSPDGVRWAPAHDMRAFKALFGIEQGALSIGIAMSEAEGVWVSFFMTMHQEDDR